MRYYSNLESSRHKSTCLTIRTSISCYAKQQSGKGSAGCHCFHQPWVSLTCELYNIGLEYPSLPLIPVLPLSASPPSRPALRETLGGFDCGPRPGTGGVLLLPAITAAVPGGSADSYFLQMDSSLLGSVFGLLFLPFSCRSFSSCLCSSLPNMGNFVGSWLYMLRNIFSFLGTFTV